VEVVGFGGKELVVKEEQVAEILQEGIPGELYRGKSVLVLTPDGTRTCPLPMLVRNLKESLGEECEALDFMVALGTHPPLGREGILRLYGIEREDSWPKSRFMDHRWDLPGTLVEVGRIAAEEVESISQGLMREEVRLQVNRHLLEYDLVIVLGPVFPHEVVGFSGGAKYIFPGVSGGGFVHLFHWLGALITCRKIIGIKDTPVRKMIHRAVKELRVPILCIALVVKEDGSLCGLYAGGLEEAWSRATDLSSEIHIVVKGRSYQTVLGISPQRYDELWTAGKVMYKLEQVVSPGGTLIIYGPHVKEVSKTWGHYIEAVGYHVRDYFLAQMERFQGIPRAVLAHLTHVKGTGIYSEGVESPDVNVVLATGIPKEVCERINLGYTDPSSLRLEDYRGREGEGILVVENAGEILYKASIQPNSGSLGITTSGGP
jgi:nickel-dependent lactate racemase